MNVNLSRTEAEELVNLIDRTDAPWPLDQLAVELRKLFGMCSKETELANKAESK
jgi:hypothetical protein